MWWESQYNIKEEDLSTVNDSVSSAWSILIPRSSASVLPQTCRRLPQSIKEDDEPRASRDISDCWWRRPALYLRSRWGFLHSSVFLFLGGEDKTFQEHISLLTQKVDTCLRWKPFFLWPLTWKALQLQITLCVRWISDISLYSNEAEIYAFFWMICRPCLSLTAGQVLMVLFIR